MLKRTLLWLFPCLLIFLQSQAASLSCLKSYHLSSEIQETYGLEIEFDLVKNPQVLEDYRSPKASEHKWKGLSFEEKLVIVRDKAKVKYLVKISTAPGWLPETLSREASGTFELTGVVFNSFSEWKKALVASEIRYGRGAAQTHLVFDRHQVEGGLSGFVAFTGDKAQLEKLEEGYLKYLSDSKKIPGTNLLHFVLGPLNGEGLQATNNFENKILSGSKILNETGGKYYFSTVLRGGIYGENDKIGFEFRQFNFDYQALVKEVEMTRRILGEKRLKEFKKYAHFYELRGKIEERLRSEYGEQQTQWLEKLKRASGQNMNFYYNVVSLLKDWKKHPVLQSLTLKEQLEIKTRIITKELELMKNLNQILGVTNSFKVINEQIRLELAKHFYELGLTKIFIEEYNSNLQLKSYQDAS